MEVITIAIMISYLSILMAIGIYSSKKVRSAKGFFLADRNLNWFQITATVTATTVGGSATIVVGGRIYAEGLPALWYDIAGALGLIILGLYLAHKIRKTGLFTLPDITGHLYDDKVRYASALLIFITEIAWVSLLIQASSLILSVIVPLEYEIILIIITAIFIAYTLIGGQYAVVYTDVIQFFIMVIGICCIAAPLLLFKALPNMSQLSSTSLSFPINENIGFLTAASIFFMTLMPHIVGPDIYSKVLSARNQKEAKKGVIIAGVFKFIFALAIGSIALSAIVLYPGLENAYLAIPTAVFGLPEILGGIILAAFLSVMLSSADSCLLSAGTILSVDIIRTKTIILSRIGILFVGIIALLLALFVTNLESFFGVSGILETLQLAYTIFTAGLAMPVLFGFYKQKTKVTSTGALWSLIIGGTVSVIWLYFAPNGEYAVLVGLAVSLIPLVALREKNK